MDVRVLVFVDMREAIAAAAIGLPVAGEGDIAAP
jgi:hypothetical protein